MREKGADSGPPFAAPRSRPSVLGARCIPVIFRDILETSRDISRHLETIFRDISRHLNISQSAPPVVARPPPSPPRCRRQVRRPAPANTAARADEPHHRGVDGGPAVPPGARDPPQPQPGVARGRKLCANPGRHVAFAKGPDFRSRSARSPPRARSRPTAACAAARLRRQRPGPAPPTSGVWRRAQRASGCVSPARYSAVLVHRCHMANPGGWLSDSVARFGSLVRATAFHAHGCVGRRWGSAWPWLSRPRRSSAASARSRRSQSRARRQVRLYIIFSGSSAGYIIFPCPALDTFVLFSRVQHWTRESSIIGRAQRGKFDY
eukprot:SAG31_NODE_8582_length_1426_cov_2.259231_2_plen_320_part_01